MSATFGSDAETKASKIIIPLGYRKAGDFEYVPVELLDANGVSFRKVLDFIPLNPNNCTIEFKTTKMNSCKSKPNADQRLADALSSGYGNENKHKQDYSWSNSAYAHAEMTAKLPPLSHVTVFESWPDHQAIKLYIKLGILFCHISGFPMLSALCMMAQHGLNTTYRQVTPDGQEITFPLLSMYLHQLGNYTSRDPAARATDLAWPCNTASKADWAEWEATGGKLKRGKKKAATLH